MSANWLYESNKPDNLLYEILQYEQKWQQQFSLEQVLEELAIMEKTLRPELNENGSVQDNLYNIVDHLIDEQGFTGPGLQSLPDSSLSNLSFCIMHKTGNELTLAMVFEFLLRQLGFNSFIAELEDEIALVVKVSSSEILIIDPLTGASEYLISNDDVKSSLVSDIANYAKEMPKDELEKMILTDQKLALLDESLFEEALTCVETLMELLPEDPYERRDRGLVLNQLDCGQWAKEDFDYFIKACPNDPMTMFIRLQLEEQSHIVATIH